MATKDYRGYAFDAARVEAAGKSVGTSIYWKLYAIENLVRVMVHSVLVTQIGAGWWTQAVDQNMQATVARFQADYNKRPWHGGPGQHEIYYTFLSDLTKIITANSNLFQPIITDIDQWVVRLELIRIPRNIVGHMNWLSANDRKRIDLTYSDLQHLITKLSTAKSVTFAIPP